MDVSKEKLGISGEGRADILNIKLEDLLLADLLVQQDRYFRGYRISRRNWISILLGGTVPMKEIRNLILFLNRLLSD